MNKKGIRWLSILVTGYLLLALVWWTILLSREALANHRLERQLFMNSQVSEYDSLESIDQAYKGKSAMIMGESIVLGISLLVGIYLIQRAHVRELAISNQQNNFLLAITHELKTPLTAIKLGIQTLLKRELPKELKDEILSDSIKEGDRLEQLINNILLSTRLASKSKFDKNLASISDILDQFIKERRYPTDHFRLAIAPTPDVLVDVNAMDIVFSNLIENALKYRVKMPIEIQVDKKDDYIQLIVADDGPGIPQNLRKMVFEKFYRIGDEDTRRTKGTGLGLYITKVIINGHKGHITITDNEPQGCKIIVQIPIKS